MAESKLKVLDLPSLGCVTLFAILFFGSPFAIPLFVARNISSLGYVEIAMGAAFYFVFWLLAFITMLDAISYIYGTKRPYLADENRRLRLVLHRTNIYRPAEAIRACLFSYAVTMYCFAATYLFLSNLNPEAFNVGPMDWVEALYFAVVTAATVGYGDIYPTTSAGRLLVVSQIGVNLVYVIFLFSLLSGLVRDPATKRRNADGGS